MISMDRETSRMLSMVLGAHLEKGTLPPTPTHVIQRNVTQVALDWKPSYSRCT